MDVLRHDPSRTVIMVAHRTSALQHADRILVFERGSLIETGTFDELAALGGPFAQLLRATASAPSVVLH
jgi:ABC-type multidrug transport system fused ATPase/permease subunit